MSRSFAVFDIDGTLIRWQLYHAIVDQLAKQKLLGPNAHETLRSVRATWKRREHPEAFTSYENTLIEIFEASMPEPATFDQAVKEVIAEYGDQVYTYTRDLVKELKSKGYVLIAISGSHEELLDHIAQKYGFDIWKGTKYLRKGDTFTGQKVVPSQDKKSVLQTIIKEHNLSIKHSVGIGDSLSDAVFLEMVENPIAFNPNNELLEVAKKRGWKIVVERKNVIYELEAKNGNYILAQTKS